MNTPSYQLQTPINAIVFDCDGTLSAIEGINELARIKGVYEEVSALTTIAMDQTGLTIELFQKRLELIQPKYHDIAALAEHYTTHCVPDAKEVIELLQRLNKRVYIVSAGLNPAVSLFGQSLKIPPENIYAVDVKFDSQGHYIQFDTTSPLVTNHGKRIIVEQLQEKYPRIIHIGDALNDFATYDMVTRFIGYGGIYYRPHLEKQCDYYIRSVSLATLLPLCLTQAESEQLTSIEYHLYNKGLVAYSN